MVHKKDISITMNKFFYSSGKDLADDIVSAPNPLLSSGYEVGSKKKLNLILGLLRSRKSEMLLPKSNHQ